MDWSANMFGRQQESSAFRHGECQCSMKPNGVKQNDGLQVFMAAIVDKMCISCDFEDVRCG